MFHSLHFQGWEKISGPSAVFPWCRCWRDHFKTTSADCLGSAALHGPCPPQLTILYPCLNLEDLDVAFLMLNTEVAVCTLILRKSVGSAYIPGICQRSFGFTEGYSITNWGRCGLQLAMLFIDPSSCAVLIVQSSVKWFKVLTVLTSSLCIASIQRRISKYLIYRMVRWVGGSKTILSYYRL